MSSPTTTFQEPPRVILLLFMGLIEPIMLNDYLAASSQSIYVQVYNQTK